MCKCLANNVACCCFQCALSVLISIISAFLIFIIIGAALIYYFNYYDPDHEQAKNLQEELQSGYEKGIDKFKNVLSKGLD